MASTPACADSTCGARTSCSTLACDGRTRASAGRVVRLGWGWTKQRRADMAWIDLPAVRAYCPPGTDALWQPRSCPSLAASEREWFTPRTLRGLARGGAQATCQREECEPFGVIPNYVINYPGRGRPGNPLPSPRHQPGAVKRGKETIHHKQVHTSQSACLASSTQPRRDGGRGAK